MGGLHPSARSATVSAGLAADMSELPGPSPENRPSERIAISPPAPNKGTLAGVP
jgi:hypothetical protein